MASGNHLYLSDSNLFFPLSFQASCNNKFWLHFFFPAMNSHTQFLSPIFSPNESDLVVNRSLKIMCSICKKWLTSLLFQLAELTHFPSLHMLDSAMPHARLSPGKGRGECSASALVPLNTWLLKKLLEQAAGSTEAWRWQPPLQPTAQLAFSPSVCSAYERALSLSTPHSSTMVSTTISLLLGYLVMGKDGLTQDWHPFWRHLTHEEPASQPTLITEKKIKSLLCQWTIGGREPFFYLISNPYVWEENMILNCFWMGFLLFLPAYRHSPGGIMALTLKNKRNRFLSSEVSVFHCCTKCQQWESSAEENVCSLSVTFSNTKKHGGIS